MVRCRDGSLYTGITKNITERVKRHNLKKASKYTRARIPVELVYQELYPTKSAALKREIQIKKWPKVKKETLIKKG